MSKVVGSQHVQASQLGGSHVCKLHGYLRTDNDWAGPNEEYIYSPRLKTVVVCCSSCLVDAGSTIEGGAVLKSKACPLCGKSVKGKLVDHLQSECHKSKPMPLAVATCNSPVCGYSATRLCSGCNKGFCHDHCDLSGKEGAPLCFSCQRKVRVPRVN